LNRKIPVLGVCVGHQLLFERSEEGELPGLGWIGGRIVRFKKEGLGQGVKIPHMAWANVKLAKPSRLFDSMPEDARFYFVHSYYAQPTDESDSLLFADYGYRFVAGVERSNIVGVQFHPEKSHKFGMRLLNNFCNY
jgi:glutamine amidotransferase